jgi:hypothetical protein
MSMLVRSAHLLLGAALLAQGFAGAAAPGLGNGLAQGPARGAGDPIGAATGRAMRPVPGAPPAAAATSVWVPARHVFVPGSGEAVLVPGHYERVISPTQVFVPPLILHPKSGASVTVPAGERPPVDVRQGP